MIVGFCCSVCSPVLALAACLMRDGSHCLLSRLLYPWPNHVFLSPHNTRPFSPFAKPRHDR